MGDVLKLMPALVCSFCKRGNGELQTCSCFELVLWQFWIKSLLIIIAGFIQACITGMSEIFASLEATWR